MDILRTCNDDCSVAAGSFLALMRGMGIIDELNGLFSIVIFFLIIVLISMTSHITKLYHDFRKLVQRCALYEKRLREVEEKLK